MLTNPKHEKFAQRFAATFDATGSYREAGYHPKNAATAAACASRLLSDAKVRERVEELLQAAAARAEITLDAVLEEIRLVAFARMSKAATWGPEGIELLDSTTLDEAELAAIAEVSETEVEMGKMLKRTLKIRFHDKLAALEKLMRRLDAYPRQKVDLTSDGEKIPLAVFLAAMKDAETT